MIPASVLDQARSLSTSDRIELIGALWETLDDGSLSSNDETIRVIADLKAFRKNPKYTVSWSQYRKELRSRFS